MNPTQRKKRIAIIGGGPAGLFLFKKIVEEDNKNFTVDIFEAAMHLGSGMPYSHRGADDEHITNVSGNEIPRLEIPITEWMATLPLETLQRFNIEPAKFSEYKVFPRLLFGEYLSAQFNLLLEKAAIKGLSTEVHLNSRVTDIADLVQKNKVMVEVAHQNKLEFDQVIICTGHAWPLTHEGKTPGYFDSPYPPSKIGKRFNHTIALRGSSLTAIDAIRTLARHNGNFMTETPHKLSFVPHKDAQHFKIDMYSIKGLLPGIRFHLDDPHLSPASLLSKEEIRQHMKENNGFVSLDFIFENDFKSSLRDKDPLFYDHIKNMRMEEFVNEMMRMRELAEPFALFKAEYEEAKRSIRQKESVYWKEMLAVLSFAMNYPAKYLSAEDMQRHQKMLMPLISIVIAFAPQGSCEEIIALYEAGLLTIIAVDEQSHVEPCGDGGVTYYHTGEDGQQQQRTYKTFIDCTGQKHLSLDDFPFKSIVHDGTLSRARLKFKSPEQAKIQKSEGTDGIVQMNDNKFYLQVPGIAITDSFRVTGENGEANPRIYIMSVPYIGGYNPDYSGLDFCEEAATTIVADIFERVIDPV
ncbi:MAG: FAD/NAD(P)-binding protein [Chitinophagaceae bacterium]